MRVEWITGAFFSPGVILQVFVTLLLTSARGIRDNTWGITRVLRYVFVMG